MADSYRVVIVLPEVYGAGRPGATPATLLTRYVEAIY